MASSDKGQRGEAGGEPGFSRPDIRSVQGWQDSDVLFGLGYSNLFGIIMANAIKHRPEKSNEISALLVMGISGGGVLPPLMGIITDATGTQWTAVLTIAAVWLYLFWLIGKMYLRKSQ